MSQEFEIKVLDLAKEKGFYPINIFLVFKSLIKITSKNEFYSSLSSTGISDQEYQLNLLSFHFI